MSVASPPTTDIPAARVLCCVVLCRCVFERLHLARGKGRGDGLVEVAFQIVGGNVPAASHSSSSLLADFVPLVFTFMFTTQESLIQQAGEYKARLAAANAVVAEYDAKVQEIEDALDRLRDKHRRLLLKVRPFSHCVAPI